MKRLYQIPQMKVLRLLPTAIICTSDYDVIEPGEDNVPAGTREFEWEEDW